MTPTSASPEASPDGGEAGFTLLETLIAFAIVAGLISALAVLYGNTSRAVARAIEKTATVEAARSALERMGPEYPLADVMLTDGPIAIRVTAEPADLPDLYHLTARAEWNGTVTTLDMLKTDAGS